MVGAYGSSDFYDNYSQYSPHSAVTSVKVSLPHAVGPDAATTTLIVGNPPFTEGLSS